MSVYIGTPGRLVELPYVSSQTVKSSDEYSFETTLEGRVKAQAKPLKRREWSLSASRYLAGAQGTLLAFVNGEWGRGPFVWVSADAQVTNLLTPDQSSCDPSTINTAGVTATGPLNLGADGWAGRSFTNPAPATAFNFGSQLAPVLQGQNVTVSAYLVGAGAQMRIRWVDAAGTFLAFTTGPAQGVAGIATRVSHTGMPPANAAQAQVQAVNATQAARPALTWTDQVVEWSDGQGCPKCVVHSVGRDLKMVSRLQRGLRTADVGFTITEVG